jgi:hypothetical protein
MTTAEPTAGVTVATESAAKPIPNPPGGGSWTWDADAEKWISNDETDQQTTEPQE